MRTSARVQNQKVKDNKAEPKKEEKPKRGNRKEDKIEKKDKEKLEKAQKSNDKDGKKSVSAEKKDKTVEEKVKGKKGNKKAVLNKMSSEEEKKVEANKQVSSPLNKRTRSKKGDEGDTNDDKDKAKSKETDSRKAQKKDEGDKKTSKSDKKAPKKGKDKADDKKSDDKLVDDKKVDDKKVTDDKPDAKKDDDKKEEKIVKLITKGGYVVDTFCPLKASLHVYVSATKAYDATLNQSNLSHNNNKFYIIQVLQDDQDSNKFYVWNRWGRVGVNGQNMCKGPLPLSNAIKEFEDKLYDKTEKGDYRILDIVNDEETKEEEKKEKEVKNPEDKSKDDFDKSKLPTSVKNLIQLIFDLKMMNNQMKEIGYDAKKMPLGKLSKSNIEKGYKILSDIAECLKKKIPNKDELGRLSSDFYSFIPHDFGFQKMINFILDSEKKVKDKLEMLQSISDIQIATKLLEDVSKSDNMIDDHYQKLKCTVEPVAKTSDEYRIVNDYVQNTHAATHKYYELEILDLFTIRREGEYETYESYSKEIHNKMLLWHGSRLTNYVGILSQGLRIAPPEAPSTGYMFGKGVYFADMVSKSANYCYTSSTNPISCMLLCEVALGNMNEKFYADGNANILPIGKHSTKGCGKTAPDDASTVDLNGIKVPIGKPSNTVMSQGSLLYNEYIVYNVKQIRMKYLIKMKFNYKGGY